MGWILRGFECECSHVWEELIWNNEPEYCPKCGKENKPVLSAPKPATYSMMSQEDKARCLRKRSREHTIKQLKQDPTQIRQTRHKLK